MPRSLFLVTAALALSGVAVSAHSDRVGQTADRSAVRSAKAETGESLVETSFVRLGGKLEAGKPIEVGVRFKIAPKWHIYWKNPGDSGSPPGIEWGAPAGWTVGPIVYPRPTIIEHGGEVTIGYEGECILKTTLTPPAGQPVAATTALEVKLDWLVCSNKCLLGRRSLAVSLDADGAAAPAAGEYPKPLAELGLEAALESDALVIRPTAAHAARLKGQVLRFIPDTTPGVSYGATVPAALTLSADAQRLVIPLTVKPQNALGESLRAAGLVTLATSDGKPVGCAEISLPLAAVAGVPTAHSPLAH